MNRVTPLIVITVIMLILEFYVYQGVKAAFPDGTAKTVSRIVFWLSIAFEVAAIVGVFVFFANGLARMSVFSNGLMGMFFSLFMAKITFVLILFGEDLVRGIQWAGLKIGGLFSDGESHVEMASRRKFLSQLGLVIAAVPFTGFLYGVIKGRYDYRVRNVKLKFDDLPESFDGFRIVQISDVHSGSFDNPGAVQRGLDMLQKQKPDLILFTGDMVNNIAEEIEPYMDMFGNLTAPFGKFSVLGNHDYGEYFQWDSREAKVANLEQLKRNEAAMGFEMLNNRSVQLERNGQTIRLAGVENWGSPPFPQFGDLEAALSGPGKDEFTVLMSHDPTHWDEQIQDHLQKVHITLSGHTHGMQMGVEIPGFRWSPVKWRYNRWADLYEHKGQFLYVNRGFGFIGYPGRLGIWPEITVLELQKA